MKNLQTLKLTTSSIGSPAPSHRSPAAESDAPETQPAPPVARTIRPAAGLRKRMTALFAVVLAASLAAVAATGSIHNTVVRIAIVGLALTVAVVVAIEALASTHRRHARVVAAPAASPAPVAVAAAPRRALGKTRIALLFVMALGFASYFGGGGTFAGFTAETTNPNDALASGTLELKDHVTTDCNSQAGESSNNVNANCDVALAFGSSTPGQEPGVYTGTATVVLTNTGTLPASKLYLWAPWSNGVLSTGITAGNSATPLSLYASGHGPAGMEGPVASGDLIVVTYGGNTQTFCAGAAAAAGATSITLGSSGACAGYSTTATYTFSAGATVQDQSSDTTAANTDCYDTQITNLTWNPTTNNPLCAAALLYVQETTGGKNYCWFGSGHGSALGMCDAPISTKPSSSPGTVTAGSTYTVTALTGNVKAGDTLLFTEGGNQVSCTANGSNYYIGATSITLSGTACTVVSGVNSGFDTNTVITDSTTLGTLASDYPSANDSISKFDTTKNYNLKQELTPVSANGTTGPTGTDLASSAARTFVVGVFIPGPAAAQNQLQALKSTFGLTWHIDQ